MPSAKHRFRADTRKLATVDEINHINSNRLVLGPVRHHASAVPNLIVIGSTVARHKHDSDPDVVPNSGLTEVT